MNHGTLTALGVAGALTVAGFITEASAACNPTKNFGLAYGPSGDYFMNFPADAITDISGGILKGRFWQAGNRAAANEGTACPEVTYLVEAGPQQLTLYGQSGGDILGTGACVNIGCVAGSQVIVVQTQSNDGRKAYYAAGRVSENADGFDYGRGGTDWTVVDVPRARVVATSRGVGGMIHITLSFEPPSGAHGEADGLLPSSILTGYQLVRSTGSSDPGRTAALWTNVDVPTPVTESGASLRISQVCNPGTNLFLAVRPIFDGGQFAGDYVGESTLITCPPLIPEPRFKAPDRPTSDGGAFR